MKLLFLCTGNYYRSRYAEARFNAIAEARGSAWRAGSRGLDVDVEQKHNFGPLSPDAARRLGELGLGHVDATRRMPAAVTADDLASASRVVAVKESEHRPLLERLFPDWADRVTYWTIHDRPPGSDYDPMHDIESRLGPLLDELERTGSAPLRR